MLKYWVAIFIVSCGTHAFAETVETDKELKSERTKAEVKLAEQDNQVVLAVDGMCCRNCGIGIGKKVCTLDFVDTEALPKGIKIDRKNSLLTVALKEGEELDTASLTEAVRKAGYSPVRLYKRGEAGSLQVIDITDDE